MSCIATLPNCFFVASLISAETPLNHEALYTKAVGATGRSPLPKELHT